MLVLPLIAATLLLSLALGASLTRAVRSFGRRRLLMDSQGSAGHIKVLRTVPNVGGVAIFWSIALPTLAGLAAVWLAPDLVTRFASPAAPHIQGVRDQTPMALGLLGAALALHILGLIDDRRALGPWIKFGVQLAVAAAVVATFDARLLTMLDAHAGGPWLSIALTILWLVVVTNAMNFMDNMDGLSGGVGVTAASALLFAAASAGQWFVAAMLAALVGALAGFLVFNFPWNERRTATIFMGDGGSLVIGFLLGFLAVRVTYLPPRSGDATPESFAETPGALAMLMPLCALAIPLYDLCSVSLIRLSQGRSPLVGDRQHFSHRLRAAGLSTRRTVLVICGCTAITGIAGILLASATLAQSVLVIVQVLLVISLIAFYEHGKGWPLDPNERASNAGHSP